MVNGKEAPVKVRSVTSTFSLKDVAVVAVAAFTAAAPFFAYDTRISVNESEIKNIQKMDEETKLRVFELEREFRQHLKEYEQETAAASQEAEKNK